jgi:hypothetical protein
VTTAHVPFVFGEARASARLAARCPLGACTIIDVLADDDRARAMFALLLAVNAESYGAVLSMPAWVQLDCAALPGGIIGFARARADVDPALYARLVARAPVKDRALLERYDGLVPLAQYTCVPTPEPQQVVGFSLLSLERGLGRRVKAMGLAMHDARSQIGVAQVDNRALRVHVGLGPLLVRAAPLAVHDLATTTIAYELAVPARDVLERIAHTGARVPALPGTRTVAIGADTARALAGARIVDVTAAGIVVE